MQHQQQRSSTGEVGTHCIKQKSVGIKYVNIE